MVSLMRMLNLNKKLTLTQQVLFTLANGKVECDLEEDRCCGRTVPDTKGTGHLIKLRAKENFSILTEIYTRELGRVTRQMVKVFTLIKRVLAMKEPGSMISNMVEDMKPGQKDLPTMENTSKVRRREEGNIFGLMDQATMEIGWTTKLMATEFTTGKTVASTMDLGKTMT